MPQPLSIDVVNEPDKQSCYTKEILERLPEWFGNQEARKDYIEKVKGLTYFAAMKEKNVCLGFLAVKIHYQHTGEIFLCGVLPEYQNKGIGKELYRLAENHFRKRGCRYVIVKTLSDHVHFEPYERTRAFYRRIGFEPLITLTEMWDEDNPCLIMFKSLLT